MSEQMRAAWSRRTDEELLHAFFLEELSAAGRTVIQQLVIEKVGPLDAYLARFRREEGALVAAFPVRGCEMPDVPPMWGHIVLAANGIGFLAEGAEESLASELASDVAGFGFTFLSGNLLATVGTRLLEDGALPPMQSSLPTGPIAPLPLLASIEPRCAWIPREHMDELLWSLDFLEVIRNGERILSASPAADADDAVMAWAEKHSMPLVAIDPAPFTR